MLRTLYANAIARPSVRPSVCHTVTQVDQSTRISVARIIDRTASQQTI